MEPVVLGKGTFGVVYYFIQNGVKYAIKKYNSNISKGLSDDALKDIHVYVAHAGINIHNLYIKDGHLHIVMPYYGVHSNNVKYNLLELKAVLFELVHKLAYLHDNGIIHRDIKPTNILGGKLIDYGISSLFGIRVDINREVYTSWYRPPECLLINSKPPHYDYSADIYALGLTILEIYHKRPAVPINYDPDRLKELYKFDNDLCRVNTRRYLSMGKYGKMLLLLKKADPVLFDLVRKMLYLKPSSRITAKQCLEHPWFTNCVCNIELNNLTQPIAPATDKWLNSARAELTHLMSIVFPNMYNTCTLYLALIVNSLYLKLNSETISPPVSFTTCLVMSTKLFYDGYSLIAEQLPSVDAHDEVRLIQHLKCRLMLPNLEKLTTAQKLCLLFDRESWLSKKYDLDRLDKTHPVVMRFLERIEQENDC